MFGSLLLAAGTLTFADASPFKRARLQPRQNVEPALICVPTTITRQVTSFVPVITTIPECVGNACGINTVTRQGQPVVTSTLTPVFGQPGDVIGGTTFINPANTAQNAGFNSFTICENDCTVAGASFPPGQTVFFTQNQPVQPGTTVLGGTTVVNNNVPVTIAQPQTNIFVSTIINGQTVTDPNQVVTIEVPIPGGVTTVTRTVTEIINPPITPVVPGATTAVQTITSTPPVVGGTTVTSVVTSPGPQITNTVTDTVFSTAPGTIAPPPPDTRSSSATVPVVTSPVVPSLSTIVTVPSLSSIVTVPSLSSIVTVPSLSSIVTVPSLSSVVTVPNLSSVVTVPVVTTASSPSVIPTITGPSASASPSASGAPAALSCSLNEDCQGRGLPLGICLNATGVPVVGDAAIAQGTCALAGIIATGTDGLNLTCNTQTSCTGIGLELCVDATTGVPIVGSLPISSGVCLFGASSNTTQGTGGLLSLNSLCDADSQCLLGLCLRGLGGQGICVDPSLAPILGSGSGAPSIVTGIPVVGPVASAVVPIVSDILDAIPTLSGLVPLATGIVDDVLSLLPLDGAGGLPSPTGVLPSLALPNILPTNILPTGGLPNILPTDLPNILPTNILPTGGLTDILPTDLPNILPTNILPTGGLPNILPSALPTLPVVGDILPGGLLGGSTGDAVPTGTDSGSGTGTGIISPIISAGADALDGLAGGLSGTSGGTTGGATGTTGGVPIIGEPLAPVVSSGADLVDGVGAVVGGLGL